MLFLYHPIIIVSTNPPSMSTQKHCISGLNQCDLSQLWSLTISPGNVTETYNVLALATAVFVVIYLILYKCLFLSDSAIGEGGFDQSTVPFITVIVIGIVVTFTIATVVWLRFVLSTPLHHPSNRLKYSFLCSVNIWLSGSTSWD